MNYRMIFSTVGKVIVTVGLLLVLPLLTAVRPCVRRNYCRRSCSRLVDGSDLKTEKYDFFLERGFHNRRDVLDGRVARRCGAFGCQR